MIFVKWNQQKQILLITAIAIISDQIKKRKISGAGSTKSQMVVSFRLSSLPLNKFIVSQKNLSKPSPRLWPDSSQPQNVVSSHGQTREQPIRDFILEKLQSCNGLVGFDQIHAQLFVSGLCHDMSVISHAIRTVFDILRSVPRAISLFGFVRQPDTFTCNTMLKGFMNLANPSGALAFYREKMLAGYVELNQFTFPLLVKACAKTGSLREGQKVHDRVFKFGFDSDLFIKNSLIHFYSVCGQSEDARQVFENGFHLDTVSWNSMIDGYVKNGEVHLARELFEEMPERDAFSWNSMITGYAGTGNMDAAKFLFERMPSRDIITWNCMIDGYARTGNLDAARILFDQMSARNAASWNIMLALYVRCKRHDDCLRLFQTMTEGGKCRPDKASLVSVLTACANLRRIDQGQKIHIYVKVARIKCDALLSTALQTMYAKCGALDMARSVFDEMLDTTVVPWNSMIMGYAMHDPEKALELFFDMDRSGVTPNSATFVCVLSACTKAGNVLEGWWCFEVMYRVYNIEPKVGHCGCMLNLLSHFGVLEHPGMEKLKSEFSAEARSALWRALRLICRTQSYLDVGEIVANRLVNSSSADTAPCILLAYMYAMEGRWDDVEQVRKMMKERELQAKAQSILFQSSRVVQEISIHRRRIINFMLMEMAFRLKLSRRYL